MSLTPRRRMRAADSRTSPFVRALFAGLPARYDRLAAVLSLGQDRRWRREMIDHAVSTNPASVLDVATGPAGVALDWPPAPSADHRPRRQRGHAGPRPTQRRRRRLLEAYRARPWSRRATAVPGLHLRCRDVHLPPSLRRRPGGDHRRAGSRAAPRRSVGQPRVRRALQPLLAGLVVALHGAVLPVAGGLLGGRAWFDVGRFLGPNITAHYERFRSPPTSPHGRTQVWATSGCAT